MKKLVLILTVLGLTGAIYGCGGEKKTTSNNSTTQEQQAETTNEETETKEPVATDVGDLGKYYVEIKDCTFSQDFEGNQMIVVNYNFTNNSDENAVPSVVLDVKAFQDGIQLEPAISIDETVYNLNTGLKEVQSGITLENCQAGYVLTSTSPVEFEVSELLSLSDKKLVKTFNVQ